MRPPSIGGLVHVGLDVLSTTTDPKTNKLLAQTGNAVSSSTDANAVEWWQHVGFCARPSKPIAGKSAAQCVVLKTSDRDVAIASQDTRSLDIYGNLTHGEVCIYAAGQECLSQGRILLKDDGSVSMFTTDTNRAGGKSVYFRMGTGQPAPSGGPDGFTWAAPWGTMKFDATGFHIAMKSGAEFHLGAIAGLPAPLDVISSYCSINAGTMHVNTASHAVGNGAVQLANAQAAMAAITSLQAQVTALQAALALFANISTNPNIAAASFDSGAALLAAATTGAAVGIAGVTTSLALMTTTASADL
jgi:hypothetical protein